MSGRPLAVNVSVVVTVDMEAWDLNYFSGTDPRVIREDVARYIRSTVLAQMEAVGVLHRETYA